MYGELVVTFPEPVYAEPTVWIDPYAPVLVEPGYVEPVSILEPVYVEIIDPYVPVWIEPVYAPHAVAFVEPYYPDPYPAPPLGIEMWLG